MSRGRTRGGDVRSVGLGLGPVLATATMWLAADLSPPSAGRMAAVAVLMATWWITEAVPLAATALLPLVLFPLLGITSTRQVAPEYVNSTIFLFVGGFLIALAMQRWGLHRRIAVAILLAIGGGPSRIVLGFMVASAFLSMWISNTATAIMMVPIGLAIVLRLEERHEPAATRPFTLALMLGIAYGCSLGGMATLVGTPPNLVFARIYEISFPQATPVAFGPWLVMALPISAVLLAIVWLLLVRVFCRAPAALRVDREVLARERRDLGPISSEERAVLAVFTATALLWVFRTDLVLGIATVPGWSRLLAHADLVDDATVAIAMASLLFLVPVRRSGTDRRRLLELDVFADIPWHIVLLFGGGFALAAGFEASGLSERVGDGLAGLEGAPVVAVIATVCGGLTFLTELTSNTATTNMILPVLASLAGAIQVDPRLLMIPATLSASCAFMMPVATPPNAIVFGSGRVRIADMARIGLAVNLIGVVVITTMFLLVGARVLGVSAG